MNWKEYDNEILIPYEKTGSSAKLFNPEMLVYSYSVLRHVAYHAFKAGASQQGVQVDAQKQCRCYKFYKGQNSYRFCPDCGRNLRAT